MSLDQVSEASLPFPVVPAAHQLGHRERLRERVKRAGYASLHDYEALELALFRTFPRGDVKPLAKRLLDRFGSLSGLLSASVEELTAVKGVGEACALDLKLMHELAQRIGLSVNVGIRDGASVVYLCHFEGALAPKSHTMIGMGQPLHASALGKCLLLDLTEEERRALLGETLPAYTANTITDHTALTAELAAAAVRGVCVEEQELALGRSGLAAPIRDATGAVVAAISVSGRLSVMRERDRDTITEQLIETADRISVGLGLISAVPHRPVPAQG